MKVEVIKIFLNKIIKSNDLLKVKELFHSLNESNFLEIKMNDGIIKELAVITKLIEELRNEINNQTEEEKGLFQKIDEIITNEQNLIMNDKITYLNTLRLISQYEHDNNLEHIQTSCRYHLCATNLIMPSEKLNEIILIVMNIYDSITLRGQSSQKVIDLANKINSTIRYEAAQIQGIKEFKEALLKNDDNIESKANETIKNVFDEILNELQKRSDQDSITFSTAYLEKQKSYHDFKLKKEQLLILKQELIPLFEKLETNAISKTDTLMLSKYNDLVKLVNNKQLPKLFTDEKWTDCKILIDKLEIIGRDSYQTLFNSVKRSIIDERYDMSLYFKNFVSSIKLKNVLITCVHEIIDSIFMEQIQVFFNTRLEILKRLLSTYNRDEFSLQKYKGDKTLQSAVEMLVLDLTEVLECDGHFADNRISLEKISPVLIGKTLRNYLAHGDALIDVLPFNPSTSIFSNALRFIEEGKQIFVNKERLIGQRIVGNFFDLVKQYSQGLNVVTNQNNMFKAAEDGNLERMKHHINRGADVKSRYKKGWSVLHVAAQGNNVELLQYLMNQNLSLESQDIDGQTCLHIAASYGSKDIIEKLLENGADVNWCSINDWTPLHLAAKKGHFAIVKTLLQNKANIYNETRDKQTALELAVINDNKDSAIYLLQNKAGANNNDNSLVLELPGQNEYKIISEVLLENDNQTEVELEIRTDDNNIAEYLMQNIRDIKIKMLDNDTVELIFNTDNKDINEFLLENGGIINFEEKYEGGVTPLHAAAFYGDLSKMKMLLVNVKGDKKTSVLEAKDDSGKNPLMWAVSSNHNDIVKFLLEEGADVNATFKNNTSLHVAAALGHSDIIETLIANSADIDFPNKYFNTAIYLASVFGHENVVNILYKNGAYLIAQNEDANTSLHVAAKYGHTNVVKTLLDGKIEVGVINKHSDTALHIAASVGFIEVIECLLNKYADINALNWKGWTPLHFAAFYGKIDVLNKLLEKGAVSDIPDRDGLMPLHFAIFSDHKEVVKRLLDEKSEDHDFKNILDKDGMRPLHYASLCGHVNIVELLLNEKADYNAVETNNNATPLHLASTTYNRDNCEIITKLLDAGAKVDAEDKSKMTPLHYAAKNGYMDITETLLKKVTDVDPRDLDSRTPLHLGVLYGHKNIVDCLLNKDAYIEAEDYRKMTPLHYAAERNNVDMVNFLLEKGANVNVQTDVNMTPLHIAVLCGNEYVVELLLNKGANVTFRDNSSFTALDYATMKGFKNIEILFKERTKINDEDKNC